MAYSLDDNWENGPMIRRAGVAAFGLYCAAGLWIARHLTDGHIPADVAADLGSREWATKLVSAGLWETTEDGFHDPHYLLRNPSAEKVRQRQKAEAERKARWRQANAHKSAKAVDNSSQGGRVSPGSSGVESTVDSPTHVPPGQTPGHGSGSRIPGRRTRTDKPRAGPSDHDVPAGQDAGQTAGVPPGVPPEVRATPPTPKGVRGGARPPASPGGTVGRPVTECPRHQGSPAHNCGLCRSEALGAE